MNIIEEAPPPRPPQSNGTLPYWAEWQAGANLPPEGEPPWSEPQGTKWPVEAMQFALNEAREMRNEPGGLIQERGEQE